MRRWHSGSLITLFYLAPQGVCVCVHLPVSALPILNCNRNHLMYLKHLWQTLASCNPSTDPLLLAKFGIFPHIGRLRRMLFRLSIRFQTLTSGGLDKLETHRAHRPICATGARLKHIIYLICNERKQPRSQGWTETKITNQKWGLHGVVHICHVMKRGIRAKPLYAKSPFSFFHNTFCSRLKKKWQCTWVTASWCRISLMKSKCGDWQTRTPQNKTRPQWQCCCVSMTTQLCQDRWEHNVFL